MSTDTPQPQDDVKVEDSPSTPETTTDETPSSGEATVDDTAAEASTTSEATPPAANVEPSPPSEAAPGPAPVEATPAQATPTTTTPAAESAPSATTDAAAEGPSPQSESSDAAPKRKLQLNPTGTPSADRPVPTVGSTGVPGPPEYSGPVELPSADDADVEAEIAKAVSNIAGATEAAAPEAEAVDVPQIESIDASIAAAVEAAMTGDTSEAAPVTADIDDLKPGQKLQGVVQSTHGDDVFLDFGLRLSGVVPFRQFAKGKAPEPGATVEVNFDSIDEVEGLVRTNLPRGTATITTGDWSSVIEGQVVECMVKKKNKGGLEVEVSSLKGFIPASQVELGYVADLESFVGQKIRAQVMEVKPKKRRFVLSRRAILAAEREVLKKELMQELKPDQVRTGRVKTIKDYGAFIDLGGVDGFLPISQMSWIRIESPTDLLQEGQEVEVKVLSIDTEKDRISLGMRQLTPNPWRTAEDKYGSGSSVTGRVTRIETFGAFVELEPGIEGLVHISELDHKRVKSVHEVLKVNDMIEVQVIEVDPSKKRISLSMKALKAKPEDPKDEDMAPGQGEKYVRKRKGDLKGGTGSSGAGGLFGNPGDFK